MSDDWPVFIDIESSGIARGAFPIEIGWARPVPLSFGGVGLAVRSVLVRPAEAWLADPSRWDSAAEPVHGLTRERLLREGLDVAEVCALLDQALRGLTVASDTGAAGWDDDWLRLLYETAGGERDGWDLSEAESGALVARHCRERGLVPRNVRPALASLRPPHSHAAAEDALRFAWEWGMAELLGRSPAGTVEAALGDLTSLLPADRWPSPTPESDFRRR